MTRRTVIECIGVYLPPNIVSSVDIIANCKRSLPVHVFERLTGIKYRHMAQGDERSSLTLAIRAIEDCFAKSDYSAEEIDLLICCNISRCNAPGEFSYEPTTSSQIQKEFNMHKALAFDLSNACAGIFTGIKVADAFIKSGVAKTALIVSGEYITNLTETAQKNIESLLDNRMACLTLGDSGTAILLESRKTETTGFKDIELKTLGKFSQLCIGKLDQEEKGPIMITDSVKLAETATRESVDHLVNFWKKNDIPPVQMTYMIPHQTSISTIGTGIKKVNQKLNDKVFNFENTANIVGQLGNLSTTSHFFALLEAIQNKQVRSGDTVTFVIQASGITIGTALYTVDGLAARLLNEKPVKTKINQPDTVSFLDSKHPSKTRLKISAISNCSTPIEKVISSMEMATAAVENCLKNAAIPSSKIDLMLYCGIYRDEYMCEPATAALLAGRSKLYENNQSSGNHSMLAFDILNSSLGFLNACQIASLMYESGKSTNTLIVSEEVDNHLLYPAKNTQDPNSRLNIEQTGTATLLSPGNGTGFYYFFFKSFSQFVHLNQTKICQKQNGSLNLYVKKNINIENHYIECIKDSVQTMLKETGCKLADFDYIVPQQISSSFIRKLIIALQLENNKTIDLTNDYHDLFTASIPFAIEYLIKKRNPEKGQKALIISVGAGIQVGCAFYEF